MARYNEIQVGRYNRYLQKLLSMKGEVPAPQLASEIGTHIVLFHGVENRYLEGWDRFAVEMDQAAVAANAGTIQLRNPAGSNVMAVIEKFTGVNVAGATDFPAVSLLAGTADLATVFAPSNIRLDPRGRSNPTCVLSRTSPGPVVVQTILLCALPVNSNFDFVLTEHGEIPLLPGDLIRYNSGIVNQRLICNFIWRERFLEDSERA